MEISKFIDDLHRHHFHLAVDGDQLLLKADVHELTGKQIADIRNNEVVVNYIRQNKQALIEYLSVRQSRPENGKDDIAAIYALSPLQQGMLFHTLYNTSSGAFVQQSAFSVEGLNIELFKKSWMLLMRQHTALRSGFYYDSFRIPVQCVYKKAEVPVTIIDCSNKPSTEQEEEMNACALADRLKDFNLKAAPLMRFVIFELGNNRYRILWTWHHIIMDGWSYIALNNKFLNTYELLASGKEPVQAAEDKYEQYIKFLQRRDKEQEELHWRNYMQGVEESCLLPFITATSRNKETGIAQEKVLHLDKATTTRLREYAQHHKVTFNTVVQGVWALLLYKYTGKTDVMFGVVVSGRPGEIPGVEGRIGMYINTLPLRAKLNEQDSFSGWLQQLQQQQVASRDYQYASLTDIRQWTGMQEELFDTILVFENYPINKEIKSINWELEIDEATSSGQDNYPLGISIVADSTTKISFVFNPVVLHEYYADSIAGHFAQALESILNDDKITVNDIPVLTADAAEKILQGFSNAGARKRTSKFSLVRQLRSSFAKDLSATALRYNELAINYGDCQKSINQYRQWLREEYHLERGERVAVLLKRSEQTVLIMLSLFESGLVYVPIDPECPQDRIQLMLRDVQPSLVVTSGELTGMGFTTAAYTEAGKHEASNLPIVETSPDDAAYIIYTSGSTGAPKGVVVSHGNLDHLFEFIYEQYAAAKTIVQPFVASPAFDISLFQILTPLLSGGACAIIDKEKLLDTDTLIPLLSTVTVIDTVPALYQLITDRVSSHNEAAVFDQVERVFIGGDYIPDDLLKKLATVFSNATITVTYGPTEGTIFCTYVDYTKEQVLAGVKGSIIGRPLNQAEIYILDAAGKLKPAGVEGELCIGGPGVSKGYWNDAEKTAAKYIANPYKPNNILYRTGDKARWLPSGEIEFMGRTDNQVKIRGYRVELQEIETLMRQHKNVSSAVVNLYTDPSGNKNLAGYYVPQQKVQLWPSISEYLGYNDLAYYAMNNDPLRAGAYRQAISKVVKGKTVVDIGTGPEAVLARHCISSGALKVYAIELLDEMFEKAKSTVESLGLQDKIIVIHGNALDVELPEKIDYCVCALVGNLGSSDGCIPVMNSARRFLKDPTCMIPHRSVVNIAVASLTDEQLDTSFTETGMAYLESIFKEEGHAFDVRVGLQNVNEEHFASDAAVFEDLDLTGTLPLDEHNDIMLRITKDANITGFVLWLNLHTAPGMVNNILDSQKSFLPIYFPVFENQVHVQEGDVIHATVWRKTPSGTIYPDYGITGVLQRQQKEDISFTYSASRIPPELGHTPFYKKVFANGRPALKTPFERVLREFLSQHLPDYMVPAYLVELNAIPLTANGKIDKKSLPLPQGGIMDKSHYTAPSTRLEADLAAIWQEMLGAEQVGIHDNFFMLGGHSLLATRVVSEIRRKLKVNVSIKDLFTHVTVFALAAHIRQQQKDSSLPVLGPMQRQEIIPLSFSQERLWFIDQLEGSVQFHIPFVLRLSGEVNEQGLQYAFNNIINRHEVLRTVIEARNGVPGQRVMEKNSWQLLMIDDGAYYADQDRLQTLVQSLVETPFNLSADHMLRAALIKLGTHEYILVVVMHHIASDGWSLPVIVREMSEYYNAFREERAPQLKPLAMQYADYATWQRQYFSATALAQKINYWKEKLTDLQPLGLATDHPRPLVYDSNATTAFYTLDKQAAEQLKAIGRKNGVSLFMTLLSVFKILLSKYTGQKDICVGAPVAERQYPELEGLVGFFVNSLVLRSTVNGKLPFAAFLQQVKNTVLDAYENQEVPFEKLVEVLGVERDRGRNPLFDVKFVLHNQPSAGALSLSGDVKVSQEYNGLSTAQVDISVDVKETAENLQFDVTYCTALYREETISRMMMHYRQLLQNIIKDPDQLIEELQLLTSFEYKQLVSDFNQTEIDHGNYTSIVEMFNSQVNQRPDAVAVVHNNEQLTYKELNERAGRLANYLRHIGVTPEMPVPLCIERSVEMLVCILGILKAGGAYVPIDTDYPADRIAYMIDDIGARFILCKDIELNVQTQAQIIELDTAINEYPAEINDLPNAHQLCYIIYTSGSTGKPKGVMIEHGGVVNMVLNQQAPLRLRPGIAVLQFASLGFDASCYEIFGALSQGGKLVLIDKAALLDEYILKNKIETEQVELIVIPPSYLTVLSKGVKALKTIVSAGEALTKEIAQVIAAQGIRLINAYGPTENTVCSTLTETPVNKDGMVTIGTPQGNIEVYILDEQLMPVPVGVEGEMYLGGAQLARGYWNRPALTAEKFIPHPFKKQAGLRLYKTGDTARRLANGELVFTGRCDEQVKIRGYRIEPGEIENVIQRIEGVKQAVVLVAEDELAACIVNEPSLSRDSILQQVKQQLPSYMVPAIILQLAEIPVTANGKTDKNRLKALVSQAKETTNDTVEVFTEAEAQLANIWCNILETDHIGKHDNFFDAGGHSILGIRVIAAIRENFSGEISIRDLFDHPTIAGFAQLLQDRMNANAVPTLRRYEKNGHVPLSFSQERIWFIDKLQGSVQYNLHWVLRLKGRPDFTALENSFRQIIRRHEVLRTVIVEENGVGYQQVKNVEGWALRIVPVAEVIAMHGSIQEYVQELTQHPFDLAADYMLMVNLVQLPDEEFMLVAVVHHMASDGWSTAIIVKELTELYRAYTSGTTPALQELPVQYADFAMWQREYLSGDTLTCKLNYWKQQLANLQPLELRADFIRPARQSIRGAAVSGAIDKAVSDKIMLLCNREEVTPFIFLLSVFKLLLFRYTGQADICVGSSVSDRGFVELESLIGFFLNTIALRSNISGDISFSELLSQVKQTTLQAYEHQQVPFEKVVEVLEADRDVSRTPVFQVLFALQNTPKSGLLDMGGVTLEEEDADITTAKFDISLFVSESLQGFRLNLIYCSDLFRQDTMQRFMDHFVNLVNGVLENVQLPLHNINMLSQAEAHALTKGFNSSSVFYPKDKTILDLFDEQVKTHPNNLAVVFEQEKLTYAQLNEKANILAAWLRASGVREEQPVVISVKRSAECLLGIMGILKAGAAYVPVDDKYPDDRIAYILEDTGARICLADAALKQRASNFSSEITFIDIRAEWDTIATSPAHIENINYARPENLAYIIYTSGSTGRPKGVMIEHRHLMDHVFGLMEKAKLERCHSYALFSTLAADACQGILFACFITGSAMHMISDELLMDSAGMAEYMHANSIDCTKIVASLWLSYLDGNVIPLPKKVLIFGGETFSLKIPAVLQNAGFEGEVYNHYGPTETTVGKCIYPVDVNKQYYAVPIGFPFSNTHLYVLDQWSNLCPVGVPGELYIGGDGVARGYINLPALTEERFIADVFNGGSMYKTGDLVRWLPEGSIEYIGRKDDQVKINGYRIELGEIESVIQQSPGVQQCVTIVKEDNSGNKRLVAYVLTDEPSLFEKEAALSLAANQLPDYMVPGIIIPVESMPLNANGKVDRKQLRSLDVADAIGGEYVAPRNAIEQQLTLIWQDLLGVEQVGVHDDFFKLGGHSLLAIRVISAVRKQMGLDIGIKEIFEYPTIASLVAQLSSNEENAAPAIPIYERGEKIPLSFAQERLWFIDKLQGSAQFHIPWTFRIKGMLNVLLLAHAIRQIIERHQVLRTVIQEQDGQGYQQVMPSDDWTLQLITEKQALASHGTLQNYIEAFVSRPFDLSKDYMLRVCVITIAAEEYILAGVMHHIAGDGWSTGILIKELTELYRGGHDLQPLPVQYIDYAAWQRKHLSGEVLDTKLSFWKSYLHQAVPLQFPADFPRPLKPGIEAGGVRMMLDKDLLNALQGISRQEGATLFMTLLTAFNVLLYRYTGEADICVGSPVAGRQQQEVEALIGFFINTMVLRNKVDGSLLFSQLLQEVKHNTLNVLEHQDVPFEKIVEAVDTQRDISRHPLFDIKFHLANIPEKENFELGDLSLYNDFNTPVKSQVDISFDISESPNGLVILVSYSKDLYRQQTIERLVKHYKNLLAAIAFTTDTVIDKLAMLDEEDENRLIRTYNNNAVAYPENKTVIDLFEEQVRLWPDNVSVEQGNTQLTYAELDQKANQLAHYLQRLGVRAETIVALCMERSPEMIIAILAVMKAGGAYLPIDAEYPVDRVEFMLEDAKAQIVLTNIPNHFLVESNTVVLLPEKEFEIACQPVVKPVTTAAPHDLAYIIYTSGSTGQPKGVLAEHKGLLNMVLSHRSFLRLQPGYKILQFASLSFDGSCQEIFNSLCSGGNSVIASKQEILSAEKLGDLIEEKAIDIATLPPSYQAVIKERLSGLKILYSAGEPLHAEVGQFIQSMGVRLVNGYGPTENTVTITLTDDPIRANGAVSIGKPISNVKVYLIDKAGNLVPEKVIGELCVAGAQVARGYLNQPALTAMKFVPDVFAGGNARMYRTGDLCRWHDDGTLEFMGRADDQLKVRGYRIEPGEIEQALQQCNGVSQAVVLAVEDTPGHKKLVGYVRSQTIFDANKLLEQLRQKLPAYMVPGMLIETPQFPVTASGKIDKKKLQELSTQTDNAGKYEAAANEAEKHLVAIWRELLGAEQVGVHDNFFELGGDSIITIQVVSRARRLGYNLEVADLFTHQTIRGLSSMLLEGNKANAQQSEQGLLTGASGLLPIQQWYFDLASPDISHYNQSVVLRIDKSVSAATLEHAIVKLIAHHDALRFRYQKTTIGWQQEYGTYPGKLDTIKIDELSAIASVCNEWQRSLSLEEGILIRAVLLETPSTETGNRLLLAIHHLAVDGVSWRILLDDLQLLINNESLGAKTSSCREWHEGLVKYGQQSDVLAQEPYWAEISRHALPVDIYSAAITTLDSMRSVQVKLDSASTRLLLQEVPGVYHTEVNDALLCALAAALQNWSNSETLVIGLEGHGRETIDGNIDINRTIGWFTNMYPVKLQVKTALSVGDQLKSVKEQLRAIPARGMGYSVLKYINKTASLQGEQPWELVFNYLGQGDNVVSSAGILSIATEPAGQAISGQTPVKDKLQVNCIVIGGELHARWSYSTHHYHESTILQLANAYREQLENIIVHCKQTGRAGGGHTPSDYGLGKEITYAELDKFLSDKKTAIESIYRLSGLQEGLLFHGLYDRSAGAYIDQTTADITDLNVQAFKQTWAHLLQHHSILRNGFFHDVFSLPVQCVYRQVEMPVIELDYRGMSMQEQSAKIKEYELADHHRDFDFKAAPLMRVTLIRLTDNRYRMIWSHHHLITDGWSGPVLMKEFLETYEALVAGNALQPQQEDRYEDYIRYIERVDKSEEKQYWQQYLLGLRQPTLLPFVPETASRTKAVTAFHAEVLEISEDKTKQVQDYAQRHHITVNTIMQGVWAYLLHRYTGNMHVAYGVTVSGRPEDLPGMEQRVGLYVNTLPLHAVLQDEQKIVAWLQSIFSEQSACRKHQYSSLSAIQNWTEIKGELFDTMMAFQNYPAAKISSFGQWKLQAEQMEVHEQTSNYPLSIRIAETNKIVIRFIYKDTLLDREFVQQMLNHFEQVLHNIIQHEEWSIRSLHGVSVPATGRLQIQKEDLFDFEPA